MYTNVTHATEICDVGGVAGRVAGSSSRAADRSL